MARPKKTEKAIEEAALPMKTGKKVTFVAAVGRRKEAVAQVRIYANPESPIIWQEKEAKVGEMLVNGEMAEGYFGKDAVLAYQEPLRVTNSLNKFAITIRVVGGGKKGQLQAAVHGISRALSEYDKEKYRPILKKKGLLTRDARIRERRKVGTGGKARRQKQSPKR